MRLAIVVHLTGTLVRLFSPALLAPAVVAAHYREWPDAIAFLATFASTAVVGSLMRLAGGSSDDVDRLRRAEGLAIVAMTWLLIAHLSAIPYIWAGIGFIDSLFESMSGLTTTGATILTDFGALGRGLFFWRSMSQWLGGLGVIALFVAILPRLAIGGRELFFAESPGPTDDKLTPQLRHTAIALWRLYGALTVAEIVALTAAGMSLFDATCHAMITLAAGGFSPNPQSLAGYNSALTDAIVTVFMFLAGASFALQYRAIPGGRLSAMVKDEELRAYIRVVLLAVGALMLFLMYDGMGIASAPRHGSFQVISILTTTGFASTDFQLWSPQAKMVLLLLMFIGGCAGSELDPVWWTRSERWIRCPEWQQPHVGGHAGNSVTSSGLGRSGWCWKRGRRSAPSPASWILPNRPCGNGSSGRAPTAAGAVPV